MPIYSFIDEDKGGIEVGFESHGYKEDGTEISEEWDKRINDYIFGHEEEFPEFFDWLDKLVDEKIQKEAESMRKEGRSKDEIKGYVKIANSLLEDDKLKVNEKYFLITLMRYWNKEKGYAYPSYSNLMNSLNITRRGTISDLIKSLETKGYIKKEVIPGKGSKYFILKHITSNKIETSNENETTPVSKVKLHQFQKCNSTNTNTRKIYIDLTFIDDVIDKVKLTQEHYDKLVTKYGKQLLWSQILGLDNYILNGKGSKYKDHYRVLNTWCKDKALIKKPVERVKTEEEILKGLV